MCGCEDDQFTVALKLASIAADLYSYRVFLLSSESEAALATVNALNNRAKEFAGDRTSEICTQISMHEHDEHEDGVPA